MRFWRNVVDACNWLSEEACCLCSDDYSELPQQKYNPVERQGMTFSFKYSLIVWLCSLKRPPHWYDFGSRRQYLAQLLPLTPWSSIRSYIQTFEEITHYRKALAWWPNHNCHKKEYNIMLHIVIMAVEADRRGGPAYDWPGLTGRMMVIVDCIYCVVQSRPTAIKGEAAFWGSTSFEDYVQ